MNYVPLYIKTENSLLDSMIKVNDLVIRAKELGYKALSICDNSMFGTMEFYLACKKNDIKPIIGLELTFDDKKFCLYAKDYKGYINLSKLATIGNISIDDLYKYSDNIICILLYSSYNLYDSFNKIYKDIFVSYSSYEEYVSLKIDNSIYMKEILYLNKEDSNYISYLTAIKNGNLVSDNVNLKLDNYLYELEQIKGFDYNLKNNYYIYDNVDIVIEKRNDLLPIYQVPDGMTSYEYLRKLVKNGLKERFGDKVSKVYIDRLNYELDIINKMGFCNYFLVVWDYVNFAKKNGILVGPGRGSAAGSLVSFVIKITDIDPIKYNLLFERFLNPERVTMPDIDIDFLDSRRQEVINYCIEKYGKKKAVGIITFGTLASKQAIRDVGRCMDIDINVVNEINKMVSSHTSLTENYNSNSKLRDYLKRDRSYFNLYKIATKLEGLKRHTSIHAAGMVISNVEIDDVIPLYNHGDMYLTSYSMGYLEDLGLLKMDFLGLKNLNIIDKVITYLNDDGININFDNIVLNDKKALDVFTFVNTVGIFQFESEGMKNFLRKFKPTTFEDIFACLALYRPGPMGNIDTYIKRKEGKEKVDYFDSSLESILKPTYGILIYQEQIMQVANVMASYTLGEADILRRAMSKKKEEILIKEREKFISRAIKNGYSKEISENVYNLILKFASYGFNKAHSVGYAMISYKMAYLKAHYPAYFMRSLLDSVVGSSNLTKDYIYEAKLNNIVILNPSINKSTEFYEAHLNKIRYPLCNIKNVGISSTRVIIDERNLNGPYKDIYDFVKRTYGKSINSKIISSLIFAGCFDEFGINRKTLINNLDVILNYGEVISFLDEESTLKPELEMFDEYTKKELMTNEFDVLGFYLTDHPVTEFRNKLHKPINIDSIGRFFDKNINIIISVKNKKIIKTKKNDEMCFLTGEDETNVIDLIMFPSVYLKYNDIGINDIVLASVHVEKRFDKYQLIVNNLQLLD